MENPGNAGSRTGAPLQPTHGHQSTATTPTHIEGAAAPVDPYQAHRPRPPRTSHHTTTNRHRQPSGHNRPRRHGDRWQVGSSGDHITAAPMKPTPATPTSGAHLTGSNGHTRPHRQPSHEPTPTTANPHPTTATTSPRRPPTHTEGAAAPVDPYQAHRPRRPPRPPHHSHEPAAKQGNEAATERAKNRACESMKENPVSRKQGEKCRKPSGKRRKQGAKCIF